MSSEDVVHIKLEYNESVNGKKAILSAEMSALRTAKTIGRYKAWRAAELGVKAKLYSKMKEARSVIKSLQTMFPEPKVPKIIKRVHKEESKILEKQDNRSRDIEVQLSEIQRRLDTLSRS